MKKIYAILALSFISFLNAVYLTISAYSLKAEMAASGTASEFFCDVNSVFSCSNLFLQDFAWIFGVPFSAIAMIVYPVLFIVAFLGLKSKNTNYFKATGLMALGGISFNGYIIFNELQIPIICLACLACTIAIATIAILSFLISKEKELK
jgi:uncharacterized membrane protein